MSDTTATDNAMHHYKLQNEFAKFREMTAEDLSYILSTRFGIDIPTDYGVEWLRKKVSYLTVQNVRPLNGVEQSRLDALDKPEVIGQYKEESLKNASEKSFEKKVQKSNSKAFSLEKDSVFLSRKSERITKEEFTKLLSEKSIKDVAEELSLTTFNIYQIKKELKVKVEKRTRQQAFEVCDGEVYIKGEKVELTKSDLEKLYPAKSTKEIATELDLPSSLYVYKLLDHFGIEKRKKGFGKKATPEVDKTTQDKCVKAVKAGDTYLAAATKHNVPQYKVRQWCLAVGVTSSKSKKN